MHEWDAELYFRRFGCREGWTLLKQTDTIGVVILSAPIWT